MELRLELDNGKSAIIVGEHALSRSALRSLLELEAGVRVTGEAASPAELIGLVRRCAPDVVVIEQSLPNCSAVEAAAQLNGLEAPPRLLVLIDEPESWQASNLWRSGTTLLMAKSTDPTMFIDALRAMTNGAMAVGKAHHARKVASPQAHEDGQLHGSAGRPQVLSATELSIVEILESGASNKRIAGALGIAEQTVKNHLTNLYRRFGVRNRVELLLSHGLRTAKAASSRAATPPERPTTVPQARTCSSSEQIGRPGDSPRDGLR